MKPKLDIKSLIITNLICIILLGITIVIKLTISDLIFYITVGLWVIITAYMNYDIIVKSQNLSHVLKSADKRNIFKSDIACILNAYHSIHAKQEFFEEADNQAVTYAYEQVCQQIDNNINTAVDYMESYDYFHKPTPVIMMNLTKNCTALANYTNKLSDSLIQLNSSVQNINPDELMDLLDSLNEVTDELKDI